MQSDPRINLNDIESNDYAAKEYNSKNYEDDSKDDDELINSDSPFTPSSASLCYLISTKNLLSSIEAKNKCIDGITLSPSKFNHMSFYSWIYDGSAPSSPSSESWQHRSSDAMSTDSQSSIKIFDDETAACQGTK